MRGDEKQPTGGGDGPTRDGSADAESARTPVPSPEPRAAADAASRAMPSRIGDYRILGKLGEGGMGVVYAALQQSPRRRVALKVVRGGQFVDEDLVRMLQREAETLARLKHPNIGAIYESGRTEDGRHYFAMELVAGVTLRAWLDERTGPLTRPEIALRLRLFRKICDAVHYAHQRGVIHRDLKPTNVVVTGATGTLGDGSLGEDVPEVKILDFGLARITEGDVAVTQHTEIGVIKGTLPYMSPEQARGDPLEIDVRTDVYALGVILFEMLTGQRPYDTQRASLVDVVRVICEQSPPPLRQVWSASRRPDADLETIVGKALEKEADRRYAGAGALSEDVLRYLTDQPILARPPSTTYQLMKFARRNRALVGGIAATALMLVTGATISTVLGLREAAQRRAAERAQADLEAVVRFQADMLGDVDAEQMGRRMLADLRDRVAETAPRAAARPAPEEVLSSFDEVVRGVNATNAALRVIDEDILERAAQTVETRFAAQPLIAARLHRTIGDTYRRLGLYERAEPQLRSALDTRRRLLGDAHPETLESIHDMASLLQARGRLEEAEHRFRDVLAARRRVLGEEHPATLTAMNSLALVLQARGLLDDAEPLYRQALEGRRRVLGDDHLDTLESFNDMGFINRAQERLEAAEEYYRKALDGIRRVHGENHPWTLVALNNLAGVLFAEGDLEQAEVHFRESLEGRRRVLGDDHPGTLRTLGNVGNVLRELGRTDRAERLHREALEGSRRVLGDDHPGALLARYNLGRTLVAQGRIEEALAPLREALAGQRTALGDDHPNTLQSMSAVGIVLWKLGREGDAESHLREALEGRRRVLGEHHADTLGLAHELGLLLKNAGRPGDAEPFYRAVVEGRRRTLGEDHADTLTAMNDLGVLLESQGRVAEALPYLREVLERRRKTLGEDHQHTLFSLNNLGNLLTKLGRLDEAEPLMREALDRNRRVLGEHHSNTLVSIINLGQLLLDRGRHERAEAVLREGLAGARQPGREPLVASLLVVLGMSLNEQRRHAEAEPLLRECLEIRRRTLEAGHWLIPNTASNLGAALSGQGRFEEAEPLLLDAYRSLQEDPRVLPDRKRDALERVVRLYEAWGRTADAARWRSRLEQS